MKKNEFQNRLSSISAQAAEQKQGTLDEARMLFEEITGEVRRQAKIEEEEARHRSPLLKFLFGLLLLSVLSAAAVGIYGIYNFPDAPVREKADGYAGKYGKPYTKEDFEGFVIWKKSLFASFAATFTLGFTLALLETRERRQRKLSE
jgi:hypothetical protein